MPKSPLPTLRPHFVVGSWMTDAGRFAEYARMNLLDTERLAAEVSKEWPGPPASTLKFEDAPAALWEKARRRDMASDSTKLFCAIAVEAFLNFYGVVRLTEAGYKHDLEMKGLATKTRLLLDHCDGINSPKSDKIVEIVSRIAARRANLAHPKSRELSGPPTAQDKAGDLVPQAAQEAYGEMLAFFKEFQLLVPDAAPHFSDEIQAALN